MFRPTYGIFFTCVGLFSLYGVAQDQINVRVAREYFTVAHDPSHVPFDDPTLMGIGWGVRASAGPGAILGLILGLIAVVGDRKPLGVRDVLPGLGVLFAFMAWTTLICGLAGWQIARIGGVSLGGGWGQAVPAETVPGFVGVACSHLGTYASGVVGGVALCAWAGALRGRQELASASTSPVVPDCNAA